MDIDRWQLSPSEVKMINGSFFPTKALEDSNASSKVPGAALQRTEEAITAVQQ